MDQNVIQYTLFLQKTCAISRQWIDNEAIGGGVFDEFNDFFIFSKLIHYKSVNVESREERNATWSATLRLLNINKCQIKIFLQINSTINVKIIRGLICLPYHCQNDISLFRNYMKLFNNNYFYLESFFNWMKLKH